MLRRVTSHRALGCTYAVSTQLEHCDVHERSTLSCRPPKPTLTCRPSVRVLKPTIGWFFSFLMPCSHQCHCSHQCQEEDFKTCLG